MSWNGRKPTREASHEGEVTHSGVEPEDDGPRQPVDQHGGRGGWEDRTPRPQLILWLDAARRDDTLIRHATSAVEEESTLESVKRLASQRDLALKIATAVLARATHGSECAVVKWRARVCTCDVGEQKELISRIMRSTK